MLSSPHSTAAITCRPACGPRSRSTRGWGVCRVVARRNREIVGGAQILIRRLPLVGAIGYVPRGPVLAEDDPVLMGILLDTLRTLAREQRIHYVLVQPNARASALRRAVRDARLSTERGAGRADGDRVDRSQRAAAKS